ncbi:MAG: hypothetical protein AAF579_00280 [Cyanobacteria bacterium P01_C01_bin.118]
MPLNIRERSRKVANCIKTNTSQTIIGIAAATHLSSSSVHRHCQAMERRNQYPESSFWETEAGHQWLVRLVFGVVYHFGLRQGWVLRVSLASSKQRAWELNCHTLYLAYTAALEKKKVGARPYPSYAYVQLMEHYNQAVLESLVGFNN